MLRPSARVSTRVFEWGGAGGGAYIHSHHLPEGLKPWFHVAQGIILPYPHKFLGKRKAVLDTEQMVKSHVVNNPIPPCGQTVVFIIATI